MQFVEVCIEYPSGLSIVDRGSYDPEAGTVHVSARVRAVLAVVREGESPPIITASWDGNEAKLIQSTGESFAVVSVVPAAATPRSRLGARLVRASWSKDQRQQFGRFCHTLTVSSIVGVVGYVHAISEFSISTAMNVAALVVIGVITYIVGMDSMNGE
ncbi:hypothetical protein VI03_08595 [Burkholderia vietnamiensis]|uniref:hypothetical protein n=1 Tax=Burkholderia vietnamiensis TaxID=60552 RepID=UPI000620E568|nr:hypothetical protein [Burkholderia vietnamiensis]KKI39291.1 hypothetical protein VI03_08595 [Burkholderia vietnamiensis]KVF25184.1 hypothetical protein WJ07_12155 [Burkholderia vietnamiensis]TPQ36196.1 hypothetical protein C2U71_26565 [Burkholderia ubonensis]HDR9086001.1 hypothetical protein [Burkholderia vietnamiensis]